MLLKGNYEGSGNDRKRLLCCGYSGKFRQKHSASIREYVGMGPVSSGFEKSCLAMLEKEKMATRNNGHGSA